MFREHKMNEQTLNINALVSDNLIGKQVSFYDIDTDMPAVGRVKRVDLAASGVMFGLEDEEGEYNATLSYDDPIVTILFQ